MSSFLIRFFDFTLSLLGLILLLPVFLVISIAVATDTRGGVFFRQQRVGRDNIDFTLFKFRTMHAGRLGGLLTVSGDDPRITRTGRILRAWKLDELPQLLNVLSGKMSLVGPRPEVRKYVDLYSAEQRKVLSVRPGITDYASIAYTDENEVLSRAADPEATYVKEIMPHKIQLNMKFIDNPSIGSYFSIIVRTINKVIIG